MTDSAPDLAQRLQAALGPQYRLEGELGRGGMGVVFRATDTTLDRPVAVKVIHPELAIHSTLAQRFVAEARTIARVRHPNIVTVHAAGASGDLLYFVMDQVDGETLRERLVRERRLSPDEVVRIVADVAAAIDAAGRAGVVHRDVKPENILLERQSGRALLTDFGIARVGAAEADGVRSQEGVAIGTPVYMSPEQATGEPVDSRSDLYSLGVVGWEMLAGTPPFQGPGRIVVSRHLTERPPALRRVRRDCPQPLADTLARALEKSPAARWQTGQAMREALLAGRTLPPRRRRRVLAAAGTAALLLAGGVVALRARRSGPPAGVNPRHSILVLPFENLRNQPALDWLRNGSVSMLALNLSQWKDLQVVDQERVHDLLSRRKLPAGAPVGLDMARQLARDAGVWTVVLGNFEPTGDSLRLVARVFDVASGRRVETAEADGVPGDDLRPLFDDLASRLLNLSGAPQEVRAALWQSTTSSLEAFRAYLTGVEALNRWDLMTAERDLARATAIDTSFGLAYYKYALTRGWLVGAKDSASSVAMLRATAHSTSLPVRERTIIAAYRAFIEGDFGTSRSLYRELIARDTADADAWYGLGEAWFHDPGQHDRAIGFTEALRAFHRALTLDPEYSLAYDHVAFMLGLASSPGGSLVLMPGDSFTATEDRLGRPVMDSAVRGRAVRRARTAVVDLARSWVAAQPTTPRAHAAMVDAYLAAGQTDAALAEVERYRALSPSHPESPFVEARIHFAAGEADRASAILRAALDSTDAESFRAMEGIPSAFGDVAAAANVFAYLGDLRDAARAIDLADRVRQVVFPMQAREEGMSNWRGHALSALYAAAGGPAATLRRLWEDAAEAARTAATPGQRRERLAVGASAAVGLLTGLAADTSGVTELGAISGEPPAREVRALLALAHHDTGTARRALTTADTTGFNGTYFIPHRPLAAAAWAQLGEYRTALDLLTSFEPDLLASRGFDARWAVLGRVRLLRAELYTRLGRKDEARAEYRRVLAQWEHADSTTRLFVQQARTGLAALGEEAS